MKKRYLLLLLFSVYVTLLFFLANQYEIREQNSTAKGFSIGFGESLGLIFRYITISLLASCSFLILAYAIYNKLSFLFILLIPFLNVAVAFIVGLTLNFVLWITQLDETVNIFQKVLTIATISTIGTTLWLLGHMFKMKQKNNEAG
jgi:hypothetical protein